MNCPSCGEALSYLPHKGFRVGTCPQCEGMWFDAGTMQPYLNLLANSPKVPNAPLVLSKGPVLARKSGEPARQCPRCGCEMTKYNYSYDSNIFLDRCSVCSGVWADKHEAYRAAMYSKGNPKLDKLASSMAAHVQKQEDFKHFVENIDDLRRGGGVLLLGIQGVLPLGDDIPKIRLPLVVLGLILLNIASLAVALFTGNMEAFCSEMGAVPARIIAGQDLFTLFSSIFCHGSVAHLAGNMFFLWIFGTHIEDALGHLYFILFYLLCGLVSGLGYIATNPYSTVPCVGASGAIAGVMAAYLILYPSSRLRLLIAGSVMTLPAWTYLIFWFAIQLFFWMLSSDTGAGIAWFAHIGGFLCGGIVAFLVKSKIAVTGTEADLSPRRGS